MIAPGFIATAMTDGLPQQIKDEVAKNVPVRRFGTAEEVAHAVCFLAADQAAYVTGQVIVVDGGLAM